MAKKMIWLKDNLGIKELEVYSGVGIPVSSSIKFMMSDKFKHKGDMDLDKVIAMAEVFNGHYNEMDEQLHEIGGDIAGEALYEDLEEDIASSMAGIIIKWVAMVRPDLIRIENALS